MTLHERADMAIDTLRLRIHEAIDAQRDVDIEFSQPSERIPDGRRLHWLRRPTGDEVITITIGAAVLDSAMQAAFAHE